MISDIQQEDIVVNIVPLNFDEIADVWWVDYSAAHVAHNNLNPDNKPSLTITMRCVDSKYTPDYYLHVDHEGITAMNARWVTANFSDLGEYMYEWDGATNREMRINLEDNYDLPKYNDPVPTEEELNSET